MITLHRKITEDEARAVRVHLLMADKGLGECATELGYSFAHFSRMLNGHVYMGGRMQYFIDIIVNQNKAA